MESDRACHDEGDGVHVEPELTGLELDGRLPRQLADRDPARVADGLRREVLVQGATPARPDVCRPALVAKADWPT
jgi:hypothetical protein